MSDPKDENKAGMDQVPQPVKIKKSQIQGKGDQGSNKKDVKSNFLLQHEKDNPGNGSKI